MKRVVLLGATGSIGSSAFQLLRRNREAFAIVGASAHSRFEDLEKLADEFGIEYLLDTRSSKADDFEAFLEKCKPDIVLNGVIGFAGLKYSLAVIAAGIPLALANKESLVTGGELLMKLAREKNVPIIPVDSEHSAIFQCLAREVDSDQWIVNSYKSFRKIILTCSGGPFRGYSSEQLASVTQEQALAHPNWEMGQKITIDSATLANKCLEFFEAMYLFNAKKDQIQIVLHPQSIVHSMVEFPDSSIMAQLSPPNMELPIAVALHYPERVDYDLPRQDFSALDLSFSKPDSQTFRTLQVLDHCVTEMGNYPIVFNAVNEVAVRSFLNGDITFTQIFDLLEQVVEQTKYTAVESLEQVFEIDQKARKTASLMVQDW